MSQEVESSTKVSVGPSMTAYTSSPLKSLLSDFDKLIVKPALELRKRQMPSSPPLKPPLEEVLDRLNVGEKLDCLLTHMKGSIGAYADAGGVETGEKTQKRGSPSDIEDEGADRAKRRRHGSASHDSVDEDDSDSSGASADASCAETAKRRLRSTDCKEAKAKWTGGSAKLAGVEMS